MSDSLYSSSDTNSSLSGTTPSQATLATYQESISATISPSDSGSTRSQSTDRTSNSGSWSHSDHDDWRKSISNPVSSRHGSRRRERSPLEFLWEQRWNKTAKESTEIPEGADWIITATEVISGKERKSTSLRFVVGDFDKSSMPPRSTSPHWPLQHRPAYSNLRLVARSQSQRSSNPSRCPLPVIVPNGRSLPSNRIRHPLNMNLLPSATGTDYTKSSVSFDLPKTHISNTTIRRQPPNALAAAAAAAAYHLHNKPPSFDPHSQRIPGRCRSASRKSASVSKQPSTFRSRFLPTLPWSRSPTRTACRRWRPQTTTPTFDGSVPQRIKFTSPETSKAISHTREEGAGYLQAGTMRRKPPKPPQQTTATHKQEGRFLRAKTMRKGRRSRWRFGR